MGLFSLTKYPKGYLMLFTSGTARHYWLGAEESPWLYIEQQIPHVASILQLKVQVMPRNELMPFLQASISLALLQQVIFFSLTCFASFSFLLSISASFRSTLQHWHHCLIASALLIPLDTTTILEPALMLPTKAHLKWELAADTNPFYDNCVLYSSGSSNNPY